MFKYLIFSIFLIQSFAQPNIDTEIDIIDKIDKIDKIDIIDKIDNCCVNFPKKKINDLTIANYNCSQLTPFGKNRCNSVLGGSVCKWGICKPITKCIRKPKYELHYGKNIDVGQCVGKCSISNSDLFGSNQNICAATEFDFVNIKKKSVKRILDCNCKECGAKQLYSSIKIPVGRCVGKCNEKKNTCMAGIKDDYNSNNLELVNPSIELLNSAAGICPLGVQTSFDQFIDNRCFVHTFQDCIKKKVCPIRTIHLDICMKAAHVSLTHTDSIRLGTWGDPLWGIALPTLNGGNWNPGDEICLTLDLDNLPGGGTSIVNNIINDEHLDVLVQDDTAIDFLNLTTHYYPCERCLPVEQNVHTIYSDYGLQNYKHIKQCECLDTQKCHRERLEETFYPGTNFEITLDVGQCLGQCESGKNCFKELIYKDIKTPYGNDRIEIIKECIC